MPPFDTDSNNNAVGVTGGVTVTPSDSADLAGVSVWINNSTSGALKVTLEDGSTPTLFLAAGYMHRIRATRIWSAGNGAGTIVVCY